MRFEKTGFDVVCKAGEASYADTQWLSEGPGSGLQEMEPAG